jgi:membrane-bound ClpP family serine protease
MSLLAQVASQATDVWLIAGFALFGVAVIALSLELVVPSAGVLTTVCVLGLVGSVVCFFLHSALWGFASLAAVLGGAPFAIGYGLQLWTTTPLARRSVLHAEVREPRAAAEALPAPGREGTCRTALRPVGRVEIDGTVHEALAEEGFLEAGERVRVSGRDGGTLRVRRVPAA